MDFLLSLFQQIRLYTESPSYRHKLRAKSPKLNIAGSNIKISLGGSGGGGSGKLRSRGRSQQQQPRDRDCREVVVHYGSELSLPHVSRHDSGKDINTKYTHT